MAKDIKHLLKEAREAIRIKDYELSLNLCKNILKEDKNNYMALVFLGVSLQEVGPVEQASDAFHRATIVDPNNMLAWNGLINYYEKFINNENKKALVAVYCKILEIESNEKKILEYCERLENFADSNQLDIITNALCKLKENDNSTDKIKKSVFLTLAEILSKPSSIPENLLFLYEDALKFIINNEQICTSKHYTNYFKLLYNQKKYKLLIEEAEKIHLNHQNDATPLEWICKVYNEAFIEETNLLELISPKINSLLEILLKIEPQSSTALFTKALLLIEQNIFETIDMLKQITSQRPGLLHAWVQLAKCYLNLHLYSDCINACLKADKLLLSVNNSNVLLRKQLDLIMMESYSRSENDKHWEWVIESCQKVEEIDNELLPHVVRAYKKMENYVEAELYLSKLQENSLTRKLLTAQLLHKQTKFEHALNILNENEKNANYEWWIEIGILYWDMEKFEKSLVPFLKAAKLNPNSYLSFMYLGRYYEKMKNLDKARRCYEKSFQLNPKYSFTGVELSKIYRKQQNWDANLALLDNIIANGVDYENRWACYQLGLHYMEQNNYAKAIEYLRYVIRTEPLNRHYWESLADAYLARGAYTSALKSYQRAAELSSNNLYPLLQIAQIKQTLGHYVESREEFENILSTNGEYVPALLGLAKTCMHQAKNLQKEQRLGSARDCAQYAMDKLTLALKQHNNLSCLWKLAADSCLFVAKLPEKYSCMLVATALVEGKDISGNTALTTEELFTQAARCYCKALSLLDNVLIWHDLAVCYLSHAQKAQDRNEAKQLYDRALAVTQHCTNINPTYWPHWNLMGNIAVYKDPPNYSLAQHAFIKAVTIELNSAVAWCNLGALYLIIGDLKLANDAFSKAQRADPNYVNSWIGQALIAECFGHEDAMDLFRHSTQLGMQQQGAIGYGYWVCKTILETSPNTSIYSIDNMHAIPVACDALSWYTENNPEDACSWNILGILKERMGLNAGATQAFKKAFYLSKNKEQDHCRINYGRLLMKMGEYDEAVEMYKDVREATFNSGSGLALALFKNQQYEESYESYEAALHWLTDVEGLQSDVLVALASMAYVFQGIDSAKTLLFQSIELKPPSPWGLYATLSLGLLHSDLHLAELVIERLQNLKHQPQCIQHYAILLSYTYILQDKYDKALNELIKLIHCHPNEANLWYIYTIMSIHLCKYKKPTLATAKCAQAAMKLGQNSKMDVTKVLCLESLATSLAGNKQNALKAAQKTVHYYPNIAENWTVLIFNIIDNADKKSINNLLKKLIMFVEGNLKPTQMLLEWLQHIRI